MAKNIVDLLARSRSAYAEAHAALAQIENDIAALEVERARLAEAPMTKADYIDAMTTRIRVRAEGFAGEMRRFAEQKKFYQASVGLARDSKFHYDAFAPDWGTSPLARTDALCFYFEETLVAGVVRVADAMGLPEGATFAENAARIAQIDADLRRLADERSALRDAMAQSAPQGPGAA